jgi:thiol-disulfide isomerase/thioredoxin
MRQSIITILIILASIAFIGQVRRYVPNQPDVSALSEAAPDFTWKEAGQTLHFASLQGRPVILHFWASWCQPCLVELPELLASAKRAGGNAQYVLVSVDGEPEKAREALRRMGAPEMPQMHYLYDPAQMIAAERFGIRAYPETILVDATGRMRRKIVGGADWNGQEMRQTLASYGKTPSASIAP